MAGGRTPGTQAARPAPCPAPPAGSRRPGQAGRASSAWTVCPGRAGTRCLAPDGPTGYLVVGFTSQPAPDEQFLLQVLGQQAGAALANARLHRREQARALQAANLALWRSMEIHDRMARVAFGRAGQDGIGAEELLDFANPSTAT